MKKKRDLLDYQNVTEEYLCWDEGICITIMEAEDLTLRDEELYNVYLRLIKLTLMDCINLRFEDRALFGLWKLSEINVDFSQLTDAPIIAWVGTSLTRYVPDYTIFLER